MKDKKRALAMISQSFLHRLAHNKIKKGDLNARISNCYLSTMWIQRRDEPFINRAIESKYYLSVLSLWIWKKEHRHKERI